MSKPRKKSKKILFILEIVVLLLFIGGLFVYGQISAKLDKIDIQETDLADQDIVTNDQAPQMTGYTTYALFGLDHRSKNEKLNTENSDTIIIASINNDTKAVKLVSVYRDTLLNVKDDTYSKANSAYAFGGPTNAVSMLNTNLDLNITDYVAIDFNALVTVVDCLGGLDIPLSYAEILVFMTQDAMPADRELIGALVGALAENPQAGAAYARQLPKKDCRFLEKYTRSFNYPEQSCLKTEKDVQTYGIKTYFCSNVCAAYDHRIYDEIGGFPEHAIFNEDMIYAGWMVKKGYGVAYVSEARVYHSHNYTCMQQFHRNFDLGVSQAEHPEVFEGVPSEGEGIRLVKKSMAYLLKTGHIWLIPGLFLQSVSKYAGYFLGKRYKKLPEKMIRSCTMNPEYWKKNK